jgi:DedD protein
LDNSTKQRLIGAALLLVVVLVVAVFLVNSANDGMEQPVQTIQPDFVSSVTTEPEQIATAEPEVLLDPHKLEASEETVVVEKAEQIQHQLTVNSKQETIGDESNDVVVTPTHIPTVKQAPDIAPKTAESNTANPTTTPTSQWVIQLASFSQQANAEALKQKVAALGLKAHIEEVIANNKTNYRVRIGPESDRKRIDQIVKKVSDSLALKPQVLTVKDN